MKKAVIMLMVASLAGLAPLCAQEAQTAPPPEIAQAIAVPTGYAYNPEGRRDPFKDLLGGRDLKEKSVLGENQMFIDDLVLFGIVKNKNVFTALIGMPQGFPMFAKIGDKFADGYVLSLSLIHI